MRNWLPQTTTGWVMLAIFFASIGCLTVAFRSEPVVPSRHAAYERQHEKQADIWTVKPRPFTIDGHEYYQIGYGEFAYAVDNHECKKCRSEMLQHFEELTKP